MEQVNPMQGMFDFFSGGSAYKKARFADPLTPQVLLISMKYGIMDHSEVDGINIGIIPSSYCLKICSNKYEMVEW